MPSLVRKFLVSPLAPGDLPRLLVWNLTVTLLIFAGLECWRPYFYLTDDNLCAGWPLFTEIGRHLKAGESPFISHYLFGGDYDFTRDISMPWHPFFLAGALLADTPGRFAIMDLTALLFTLLAVVGFTLLAEKLVREFNVELPVIYIVFYTASWLFTSFSLMVNPSWMQFLGSQSALPWLLLAVLDRRLWFGAGLVTLVTIHQVLGGYAAATLSNTVAVGIFALGLCWVRRSPLAVVSMVMGTLLGLLLVSPFLLRAMMGFLNSARAGGVPLTDSVLFSVPVVLFPFAFFAGTWSRAAEALGGFPLVNAHQFPYVPMMLACAASWCLLPAVCQRVRWRRIEWVCLVLLLGVVVMMVRPRSLGVAINHLPVLRSLRWPFREALQLLFFVHVFLLLRPQGRLPRWEAATALFSLVVFIAPLPFQRAPTFNPLLTDRAAVLSGRADHFWSRVRPLLGPASEIATVVPLHLWNTEMDDISYAMLGTADFPAAFRVRSVSGYSSTVPLDQLPLKVPAYFFGGYDETRLPALLTQRPGLNIIRLDSVHPLRISLVSPAGTRDLTPLLDP